MRIIAGNNRGLKLSSLDGINTRPTTDRIKETLFNIINQEIAGAKVLDLFSGSGSLGLECISRGCEFATLVENFPDAVDIINKNIAHGKFQDKVKVVKGDVEDFLIKNKNSSKFNIIFLDPPYLQGLETSSLKLLYDGDFLDDDGIIIIEHSSKTDVESELFEVYRKKEYKVTSLTFLRKK